MTDNSELQQHPNESNVEHIERLKHSSVAAKPKPMTSTCW